MRIILCVVVVATVALGFLVGGCHRGSQRAESSKPAAADKLVTITAIAEVEPSMLPAGESLTAEGPGAAGHDDLMAMQPPAALGDETVASRLAREMLALKAQQLQAQSTAADQSAAGEKKAGFWSRQVEADAETSAPVAAKPGAEKDVAGVLATEVQAMMAATERKNLATAAIMPEIEDGLIVTAPNVAEPVGTAASVWPQKRPGGEPEVAAVEALGGAEMPGLPQPLRAAELSAGAAGTETDIDIPGLPGPARVELADQAEAGAKLPLPSEAELIAVAAQDGMPLPPPPFLQDQAGETVEIAKSGSETSRGGDQEHRSAALLVEILAQTGPELRVALPGGELPAAPAAEAPAPAPAAEAAPAPAVEKPAADPAKTVLDELANREKILAQERQAAAEANFRKGLDLYEHQAYVDALPAFEAALAFAPDHVEALAYRDRTRRLLGDPGKGEADRLIKEVVTREQTRLAATEMRLKADMDETEKLYLEATKGVGAGAGLEALAKSIGTLDQAMDRLRQVDGLLGTATLAADSRKEIHLRVQALRTQIVEARGRLTGQREQTERELALKQKEEQELETQSLHKQRIGNLLTTAEFHFNRKEYDKSIELCEEVLKLEPRSEAAVALRSKARQAYHLETDRDNAKSIDDAEVNWALDVADASILPSQDLVYPKDWERIKRRVSRKHEESSMSPAERKILEKLENERISVEYHENPLSDVLRQIGEQGQLNIVVAPGVDAENITIDHFAVRDMTLARVLEWIMTLTDLKYKIEDEAIYVRSAEQAGERVVLQLYPVADLTRGMRDYYPTAEDAEDKTLEEAKVDNLPDEIRKFVAPDSWENADRSIDMWQDNLLVMQTPEVHTQILKYLDKMREAAKQQVLVEGRILDVDDNFMESIGFQWYQDTAVQAGGSDLPMGVYYEDVRNDREMVTGANFRAGAGAKPSSAAGYGLENWVSYYLRNPAASYYNYENYYGVATAATANAGDVVSTLLGETFKNFQINALVTAIKNSAQGSVLHSPKVLVANGKNAYTRVATETRYVRTYTQQGDEFQPELDSYNQGVTWNVRPVISFDRKYITIRLRPRIESLVLMDTFSINLFVESENSSVSSNSGSGPSYNTYTLPMMLPRVRVTQLESFATIPDGGTILMGGFIEDNRSEAVSGTPALSNLPIVGKLLRSETTTRDKSNMVIIVHGKIVELDG